MIMKGSLIALTSVVLVCGVGGKPPENNCSLPSDSGCVYTCKDGSDLDLRARSSMCLPCQMCCNDDEDKKAVKCANYYKCQFRSPCPTSKTMPPNTTTSHKSSTTTDLHTAEQHPSVITETTAVTTGRTKKTSLIPATPFLIGGGPPYQEQTINIYHENKNNHGYMILLTIIAVVIVFLATFLVWDKLKTQRNPARNNHADITSTSLELCRLETECGLYGSTSQEQPSQVNITLEELEHKHLEALEWMCGRLDHLNGQSQDFELLASKYPRITIDQRRSLQNEFKNSGGSPSRALVKHLQVLYPNLTVRNFLRSLTEINRHDIVQGLQQRIIEDESSTVV